MNTSILFELADYSTAAASSHKDTEQVLVQLPPHQIVNPRTAARLLRAAVVLRGLGFVLVHTAVDEDDCGQDDNLDPECPF